MLKYCVAALGSLAAVAAWTPVAAADFAAIFAYSRVADERQPAWSIESEQLDDHIAALKSGGFKVLPLTEVVAAFEAGRELPERSVAITVDEASQNFLTQAWPRLRDAGLPVTVFVAADQADRGGPEYLGWSQIRELAASPLVTIGLLGASRGHLARLGAADIAAELTRATERFRSQLGKAPELLVWPLGEASAAAMDAAKAAGIRAAFGQHSGPAWAKAERRFLPRFPLTKSFGDVDRFRTAANSVPLRLSDITPADPLVKANPPAFGFTLDDEQAAAGLTCFTGHDGKARLEQLGPRMEVRMARPIPAGRGRLSCIAPALDGRSRWFGWMFAVE
jgi:peptidoglycan/xylan/chitin deacetylase (PgdA/CDA1 family)